MIERRSASGFELRAEGDGANVRLVGYSAVFNELSHPMWGFRERIDSRAFDKTLAAGADIVALFNHDPNFVLGRTLSGTLKTSVDERGLIFDNVPPATQTIRDLVVEPIKRGDVRAMSFAFRVVGEDWSRESGEEIRTLTEVELVDESPVTYPAYPQTEVGLRSVFPRLVGVDLVEVGQVVARCKRTGSQSVGDRELIAKTIEVLKRYAMEPEAAPQARPDPATYGGALEYLQLATQGV